MSSSMEGDVNDVVNITDEMDNELQANVGLGYLTLIAHLAPL